MPGPARGLASIQVPLRNRGARHCAGGPTQHWQTWSHASVIVQGHCRLLACCVSEVTGFVPGAQAAGAWLAAHCA